MGEAKYRKAHEPNYGKRPSLRGLILSNPMEASENSFYVISNTLDPQELRSSLFYWDRLSWPENNFFAFNSTPDIEFLQSSGYLDRPMYTAQGTMGGDIIIRAHQEAYKAYEKKQPGVWSYAEGVNSLEFTDQNNRPRGTLIQLLNAVPVPSAEVPLAEILEFKTRRRDELLEFREHFEGLVESIANHDDYEGKLLTTVKEVDRACSNLLKTTKEWQQPVKLSNVKSSLNFDITKAIAAASAAYKGILQTPLGLSLTATTLSSVGAAILSQIKINGELGYQGIRRTRSPYKYAYLAQRDL